MTSTALVPIRQQPQRQLVYSTRGQHAGATIGELCDQFRESKDILAEAGEYSDQQLYHVRRTLERVRRFFGERTLIEDVRPPDFMAYRASLPKDWGVHALGNDVTRVRAIFNHAFNVGLIDRPPRFGDFKKPTAKAYRKSKRERPSRMFEADEIRKLLEAASVSLRPLLLLGINCGLGNSDVGRITFRYLDLETGWHTFPRPKTEVERRCPLWPETLDAIKRYLPERPTPASSEYAELVFLNALGTSWADGGAFPPLCKKLRLLMKRLGIRRQGLNFYGLRRSFRTVADAAKDTPAAAYIMGHTPAQNDMDAVYTLRVEDDRLIAVSEFVRDWLFGDNPPLTMTREQSEAQAILAEWDASESLTGPQAQAAIERLRVPQTTLARYIGRNAQWMNRILVGAQPLSPSTEARIRRFVQQLADGIVPTPPADDAPEPLALAPIGDEVRQAISRNPLTRTELALLVESLSEIGITQTRLAKDWGLKASFYWKLRNGKKSIPKLAAVKLRVLFGLQPGLIAVPEAALCPRVPGKIPATRQIERLFERESFGPDELRIVLHYLRTQIGINSTEVDRWLGLPSDYLTEAGRGRRRRIPVAALRCLFDFARKDGEA